MSAQKILEIARAKGVMITTAESCTGGLIAGSLTEIPGSSKVLDRGFVTYSNDAKMAMLGVRAATLEAHGAVSEEVAAEMAEGALYNSKAELALSVTGIAGPGGSDHKPEGRVCFGVAQVGAPTRTETVEFGARGRSAVRAASVAHGIALLLDALTHKT
ncbi:MAG: CinA family protein [Litoreibacter sp.]|nr:CinA family protein [Litoreibacter sp.]